MVIKNKLSQDKLLAITNSPGAQYILVEDHQPACEINSGVANVSNKRAVEESTTFSAYSLTKTLTAAAIMQLVEQGMIALDEVVNNYFPEFSFSEEFSDQRLLDKIDSNFLR